MELDILYLGDVTGGNLRDIKDRFVNYVKQNPTITSLMGACVLLVTVTVPTTILLVKRHRNKYVVITPEDNFSRMAAEIKGSHIVNKPVLVYKHKKDEGASEGSTSASEYRISGRVTSPLSESEFAMFKSAAEKIGLEIQMIDNTGSEPLITL